MSLVSCPTRGSFPSDREQDEGLLLHTANRYMHAAMHFSVYFSIHLYPNPQKCQRLHFSIETRLVLLHIRGRVGVILHHCSYNAVSPFVKQAVAKTEARGQMAGEHTPPVLLPLRRTFPSPPWAFEQ